MPLASRIVFFVLALITGTATLASEFYPESSGVTELTSSNFRDAVLKSDQVWVVEFYAPWCGHCKQLQPEYVKAANALSGIVNVAAVDMTEHESVGAPYGVQGFPTIKIFGKDKSKPKDYNGARTAAGIVDSAIASLKDVARSRLKNGSSKGSGSSKSRTSSHNEKHGSSGDAMINLTDDNFDEVVFDGQSDLVMVAFTAPWCGHCKALLPEWKQAAEELEGLGVRLVNVDATEQQSTASRFMVQGYPTIKVFPPDRSDDNDAFDYNGPRTSGDIASWALREFENRGGSVSFEIPEVNSKEEFDLLCKGKSKKCALVFLPDIRDTMKSGRLELIELLKQIQKRYRHTPIGWVEGGSQPAWEESLNMNFGFPAMVYLRENGGEELGFVYRGKFTDSELGSFLVSRKSLGDAVVGWPRIVTTTPWDGEDPPPLEDDDDFDLEAFLAEED